MILAFGNRARHGKDTCCEAIISFYRQRASLAAKHGLQAVQVKRVNFADALRREVTEEVANSYNGDVEAMILEMEMPEWVVLDPNPDMTDPLLPHGKHPKLLQWWGTEYRRKVDPDYWVKKWQQEVLNFKGVVVTGDLRFLNEAAAIKQAGGFTVNVTRLNQDGSPYRDIGRPVNHVSETELDNYNWDFYIKTSAGHAALTGEQAITLAEYLTALTKEK